MHTRVAVIRGGPSDEHEVSIQTGDHMLRALPKEKYAPVDIVITKSGEWLRAGRSRTPEEALQGTDVALLALHGAYGEDGTIQRELDRLGVLYTGSGAYQSAIAMHKAMAKDQVRTHGVRVAQHVLVTQSALEHIVGTVRSVVSLIGADLIVKPAASGSSIGIRVVSNEYELQSALTDLLQTYDQVLVEERIHGKEATVGVIDGFRDTQHYALPPIEVLSGNSVYDYEAKFAVREHGRIPSTFSYKQKQELERLAVLIHHTLGLRHYSRSDFIVTDDDIYFLEVNTLPGCTEQSFIPLALHSVGSSMTEFLDHILTRARAKRPVLVA